ATADSTGRPVPGGGDASADAYLPRSARGGADDGARALRRNRRQLGMAGPLVEGGQIAQTAIELLAGDVIAATHPFAVRDQHRAARMALPLPVVQRGRSAEGFFLQRRRLVVTRVSGGSRQGGCDDEACGNNAGHAYGSNSDE